MIYQGKLHGFTLVEVLVSLAIFMIASMGLLPLLLTSLQVNHDNARLAKARRMVGDTLAELQVVDDAGLALAAETPFTAAGIGVQARIEQNAPHPGQTRITVTARWDERGRGHRYQLQTIRTAP